MTTNLITRRFHRPPTQEWPMKRWFITYWHKNEPHGPVLTVDSRLKPTRVAIIHLPLGCTYTIEGGNP